MGWGEVATRAAISSSWVPGLFSELVAVCTRVNFLSFVLMLQYCEGELIPRRKIALRSWYKGARARRTMKRSTDSVDKVGDDGQRRDGRSRWERGEAVVVLLIFVALTQHWQPWELIYRHNFFFFPVQILLSTCAHPIYIIIYIRIVSYGDKKFLYLK